MKNYIYLFVLLILLISGYFYFTSQPSISNSEKISNTNTPEVLVDTKDTKAVSIAAMGSWKNIDDESQIINIDDKGDYAFFETKDVPGEVIQNIENFSTYFMIKTGANADWYKVTKISNLEFHLVNPDTGKKLLLKK